MYDLIIRLNNDRKIVATTNVDESTIHEIAERIVKGDKLVKIGTTEGLIIINPKNVEGLMATKSNLKPKVKKDY